MYAQETICRGHYEGAQGRRHLSWALLTTLQFGIMLNSIIWHEAGAQLAADSLWKLIVTVTKKGHESGTCWKVGVEKSFSSPLTMTSLDQVKKKERSANWLAKSPQTNGQLALHACRPPLLGCLATPSVLLGCLMTLVAAVALGLLMKPPDQSLPFKTWKLTDHWTGILGFKATLNLLCETNSAPNLSRCQHPHLQYVHAAHLNSLLTMLQLTLILSTAHSHISLIHPIWTLPWIYV